MTEAQIRFGESYIQCGSIFIVNVSHCKPVNYEDSKGIERNDS